MQHDASELVSLRTWLPSPADNFADLPFTRRNHSTRLGRERGCFGCVIRISSQRWWLEVVPKRWPIGRWWILLLLLMVGDEMGGKKTDPDAEAKRRRDKRVLYWRLENFTLHSINNQSPILLSSVLSLILSSPSFADYPDCHRQVYLQLRPILPPEQRLLYVFFPPKFKFLGYRFQPGFSHFIFTSSHSRCLIWFDFWETLWLAEQKAEGELSCVQKSW